MFDDPHMAILRVPRSATCKEMVERHREHSMLTEGTAEGLEDIEEAGVRLYNAWVDRMLKSGQLVKKDERWVCVSPARIPRSIVKVLMAWFH